MNENKSVNDTVSPLSQGTDVLSDADVSRETSAATDASNQPKVDEKHKAQLDKVRKKGGITDDDPFDFNNPSLKELYRSFRDNKLSRKESLFNALYLWCYDNYYSSGVGVKNKYKNIYAHPSAWFRNTHLMWKHNKWSVAVKLLEIFPAIENTMDKFRRKRKSAKDSMWQSIEYGRISANKAINLCVSLISITGIAAVIFMWQSTVKDFDMIPALSLYIDGEYVGEVLSMADVEKAKNTVEDSLSLNLGKSYTLDCAESYKATKIAKGANLSQSMLNRAFGEVAHVQMKSGYGLYDHDTLLAVVERREWLDECINEHLLLSMSEEQRNDETIDKIAHRDLTVSDKRDYPEHFFSTYEEIRHMFSLPIVKDAESNPDSTEQEGGTENTEIQAGVLNLNGSTLLSATSTDAGTSSDVQDSASTDSGTKQISVEIVISKTETVNEKIPYGTNYTYDDSLAENIRYVTKSGVYGSKTATYHVEYVDDTEISRRLISEVVVSEPRNEEVKQGTRPLTEEEKRVKSTGTYIYPSSGKLSSGYGWRTWGSYDEFHKGMDFWKSSADAVIIKASDGGTVIQAGDKSNGYGLCILIQHDDGTITRYAHCSKLYVSEGQKVAQGQYIADMGATGWVTGVHLHFEIIKNGTTVNPANYLVSG